MSVTFQFFRLLAPLLFVGGVTAAHGHQHSGHEPYPPRWICTTIGSFPDLNCFARCHYRDGTREVLPVTGANVPIVGRNYLCVGSDVRNNCGDRICKTQQECDEKGFPYDPCHNREFWVCQADAQAETGLMCVDPTPIPPPPEPVEPTAEPVREFPATWDCDDGLVCTATCFYYDGTREQGKMTWHCPDDNSAESLEARRQVCRVRAVRATRLSCSVRGPEYSAVRYGENCVLRIVKNYERNRAEVWKNCWNPPDNFFLIQ